MGQKTELTAVLEFQADAAVAGMRKAGAAFEGLEKHANRAKAGFAQFKEGLTALATAGTAALGGFFGVMQKYAAYSEKIGSVRAALVNETNAPIKEIELLTKQMGRDTVFSAAQAAEAYDNLVRGGLDAKEAMKALGPALDTAAAEGMDLATAAEIMVSNLNAFGLDASKAARVGDVLAHVSAVTASKITGLQEGLKFAAPVARTLGISFEDTASALGALSDVGLKGTLAGTALKNAMLKIASAAKDGQVPVGDLNAQIVKGADGNLNLVGTFKNINATLANIPDPLKRVQALMELLELRGMGTATAFDAIKPEKLGKLFENMGTKVDGTAKRMAKVRLDNLAGDVILLKSSLEGLAIEIGTVAAGPLRGLASGTGGVTQRLNDAITAFQWFGKHPEMVDQQNVAIKGLSRSSVEFTQGLMQGLDAVKQSFITVGKTVTKVAGIFGISSRSGVKDSTKTVVSILGIAAAWTPVLIAIKMGSSLMKGFFNIAVGGAKMAVGALGLLGGGITTLANKLGIGGSLARQLPVLSKILPGVGRAVSMAEKLTAQPVRVVNFDEAGGFGGFLGGRPGAAVGSTAADAAKVAGGAAGAAPTAWASIKTGAEKVAQFGGVAAGAAGTTVAAGAALVAAKVLLAAGVGLAIGHGINVAVGKATGKDLSTRLYESPLGLKKIADLEAKVAEAKGEQEGKAVARGTQLAGLVDSWTALAASGKTEMKYRERATGEIKTGELTQEFARTRLIEQMRYWKMSDVMIADALKKMEVALAGLPKKDDLKVEVKIDQKVVGTASAKDAKERGERAGERPPPGKDVRR